MLMDLGSLLVKATRSVLSVVSRVTIHLSEVMVVPSQSLGLIVVTKPCLSKTSFTASAVFCLLPNGMPESESDKKDLFTEEGSNSFKFQPMIESDLSFQEFSASIEQNTNSR